MAVVKAAGLIIFRKITNEIEYLLLKTSYGTFHWSPPKGHVDPGESDYDTAVRETEEESGINSKELNLVKDFEKTLRYNVKGRPKVVKYWLAEVRPDIEVILSSEHTEYKWLQIEEACTISEYADMQETLRECHSFLQSKS